MDPTMRIMGKAIKAASKKLPIKGDRALNDILEFAADTQAEAYRIGAEEAQREIVARLHALSGVSA